MLELDDGFLAEVGLDDLQPELRVPFLHHVYETLEFRVGVALSADMTDDQLREFEQIIDRDASVIDAWLAETAPDFESDPLFEQIRTSAAFEGLNELRAEYAASKWLEVNRPGYGQVVLAQLEALKREIISSRDLIALGIGENIGRTAGGER